jgi:hypothetical protein
MKTPANNIWTGKQHSNGVHIVEFISNRQRRWLINWHDLTEKERAEFDYLDSHDKQYDASFVRYKGWVYDLSCFMRTEPDSLWHKAGWHGTQHSTAFSGVLIHLCPDDSDCVVMGQYRS